MFRGLSKDVVPVLYQIHNLSKRGYDYFKLDNLDYSLFPNEQEVLLYTGLWFEIIEIKKTWSLRKKRIMQIKIN